ncbi:MAG: AAA family ATPase [Thiomargarita sp.]|nr:AAA family ATPase [Thiomargarita sp.]
MLSYFEIENFLSFESGEDSGLNFCGKKRAFPPTNVAMIFGNNASGKTNLIKAIEFFQNIFLQQGGVSKQLFFAHQNNKNTLIHIECEIIIEGNSFWYENTLQITEDMLESLNETLTVIFYHTTLEKKLFQYESSPQENLHLSSYLVKANVAKEDKQHVKQFLNYVKNITIVSKHINSYVPEVVKHLIQDVELKKSLISLISQFDLHISDTHEQKYDLFGEQVHVQFHHQDLGKILPQESESHGTLGLYVLIYFILLTLRDNRLLIIDEIESAIHLDIVEVIIRIITKNRLQKKYRYPQFIFTTHQIELMKLLGSKRAIFLVEKNSRGATNIHCAEDFENISSVKNAYKQYKLGRLGAVPFLSEKIEQLAIKLRKGMI